MFVQNVLVFGKPIFFPALGFQISNKILAKSMFVFSDPFTKHPFNYLLQLRKGNIRGLYCSYLLKKIHAFRAAIVTEQKTQSPLEKHKGLLFDHKYSKESSMLVIS